MKTWFLPALMPAVALGMVSFAAPVEARDLFQVTGTVSDVDQTGNPYSTGFDLGFSKAKDAIQFLEQDDFTQAVPGYREDVSQINGSIAFRGVPINLAFPQNSALLTFAIPMLGEQHSFQGANGDRDDALDQLKDYLLENSGDFLRRFQRALIASSPNDPTAGNPNSLQSSMTATDFATGGFDTTGTTPANASQTDNKIFIGVSAGTFRAQGVNGTTISLPLAYTARFDADPRYQLNFTLPLTYINQSGAKTGAASFGAGFQFPLKDAGARNQWFLTPRFTVGATGSVDAAAASILASGSLTSRFVWDAGNVGSFTLADMVAYNMSIPFHISDVRGDYKIHNAIFKNGIQYQKPLDFALLGGGRTSVQVSYAMTNFTGTKLYMNTYHEVAMSLGTLNDGATSSLLRLGVNGMFGKSFHKYTVTLGYLF